MITLPANGPRLTAPPDALDDDPQLSTVMTRDVVAIDVEAWRLLARRDTRLTP